MRGRLAFDPEKLGNLNKSTTQSTGAIFAFFFYVPFFIGAPLSERLEQAMKSGAIKHIDTQDTRFKCEILYDIGIFFSLIFKDLVT